MIYGILFIVSGLAFLALAVIWINRKAAQRWDELTFPDSQSEAGIEELLP